MSKTVELVVILTYVGKCCFFFGLLTLIVVGVCVCVSFLYLS